MSAVAANPALPADLVDRLIASADEWTAAVLADREDLTPSQARVLAARDESVLPGLVKRGLLPLDAVDPATRPDAALVLLAEGAGLPSWPAALAADPAHRERLAACPGLPAGIQELLAGDQDVQVVAELALWAGPDLAARLSAHPHAEVRSAVAVNVSAPPEVLATLVTGGTLPPPLHCLVCDRESTPYVHDPGCPRLDCDLRPGASCDGSHESTMDELRLRAISNPSTPPAVLLRFADAPSMLIRRQLAQRPDLPQEIYEQLAACPEPGVRSSLAANPGIGDALIHRLAEDPDPLVRRDLAGNPRIPPAVLDDLSRTTRIGATLLPRIAAASGSEVEELAASANPVLRMLVAARRDLPPAVRDALAADPDAKVVKAVAGHPGLSDTQLRAMIGRHGAMVAAAVATNPDASPALLEELTRHRPPVRKVLREVARHPNASAAALLTCLDDHRAGELAAAHPGLPREVMESLLAAGT
ncbi:hypothetical protein ACIBH1_33920 [Nonomuraea sp. NPDC050663]|uniref:hypothetical protein n=1 Tax=Nonomuraea sp. NPDC050663 TaxID=3364370 RepID=UPI0037B1A9B4